MKASVYRVSGAANHKLGPRITAGKKITKPVIRRKRRNFLALWSLVV